MENSETTGKSIKLTRSPPTIAVRYLRLVVGRLLARFAVHRPFSMSFHFVHSIEFSCGIPKAFVLAPTPITFDEKWREQDLCWCYFSWETLRSDGLLSLLLWSWLLINWTREVLCRTENDALCFYNGFLLPKLFPKTKGRISLRRTADSE